MQASQALVCVLAVLSCALRGASANGCAIELDRILLDAIRTVESNGDVCAIGDSGRSLGPYQITQDYFNNASLQDPVLLADGGEFTDVWGLNSTAYSEEVIRAYMCRYATIDRLGRQPTSEDIARIHAGGPDGFNDPDTEEYWTRVVIIIGSIAAGNPNIVLPPNTGSSTQCGSQCGAGQCCQQDNRETYRCFCVEEEEEESATYGRRTCQDCNIAGIDLVFVLDASGSITLPNFQLMLEFVSIIVSSLEIGPDASQVAVIRFAGSPSVLFGLTVYDNQTELLAAISNIIYTGGSTGTAEALNLLVSDGFIGARPDSAGIPRYAIVVTDGVSNSMSATAIAAAAVHAVQPTVTVVAAGIGNFNLAELQLIASDPDSEFVVTITGFNTDELVMLTDSLREGACQAATNISDGEPIVERPIEKDREAYFILLIPEDGITIVLVVPQGSVILCGSTTIRTPSCIDDALHDWSREVTGFADIFITPEGLDADSLPAMARRQAMSTDTVFTTVQGLQDNSIFSMNTTGGDTRIPRASFDQNTYDTPEDGEFVQVCVNIVNATNVTITLDTADGTANSNDPGGDYVSIVGEMLTFSDTVTQQCVNISILDDMAVEEPVETFVVTISTTDTTVTVPNPSAIVSIMDNDTPDVEISFTNSSVRVDEGDGQVSVCVDLTLTAGYSLGSDFTVDLITMDGSRATLLSDFLTPSQLTFIEGTAVNSTECTNLTIVDDFDLEGDHSFTVAFGSVLPTSLPIGVNSQLNVTIIDNDMAVVEMAVDALMFNESDGSVMVCAELATGNISECPITVVFDLTDPQDTACYPDDYNASIDPVPIDQGMACLDVTIIQDLLLEGSQAFTVSIASLDIACLGDVIVSNTSSTTVVTIEDDDDVIVGMTLGAVSFNESDGAVTVCAEVVSGNISECSIDLLFTDISMTAASPDDYTIPSPTVPIMPSGMACLTLSIVDDFVFETDESFEIAINNFTTACGSSDVSVSDSAQTTTVTILDNDNAVITMITNSSSVSEGASVTVTVEVINPDAGLLDADISVNLQATPVGTTSMSDFVLSPLNLTLNSGAPLRDAILMAVDDTVIEGKPEEVLIVIDADLHPRVRILVDSQSITIVESDISEAQISFTSSSVPVGEGAGQVSVCVDLTLTAGYSLECDFTVDLITVDGDKAILGEDFLAPSPPQLLFSEGTSALSTSLCTNITIMEDTALEGDHSFTVAFGDVSLSGVPMGTISSTVTITDNNTVSVELVEPSPAVEGDPVTVCGRLRFEGSTNELQCAVTVNLNTTDGKAAVQDEDFSHPGVFSITFEISATDNSEVCVDITTFDDDAIEGDHSFSVLLESSSLASNVVLSPQTVTAVIYDNDNATLGFEQPSYQIAEGAGSVDVCVEISDVPSEGAECNITVSLAISDGAKAVSGEDFTAPDPLEVVFMADMVSSGATACATISIVNDTSLEGPHSFTVSIVGSNPPLMTNNPQTEVAIEDNDEAEVALSPAVYRVGEEAMSVEVQVELVSVPAGGLECPITVTLTTMDGRKAMNNIDFLLEDMMVTFDLNSMAGDTQIATISITDDDIFEGAHNFNVSIVSASPAPNVVVVSPSSAVVIISDNDVPIVGFADNINEFWVDEEDGELEVCLTLVSIPPGGLECDIAVTFDTSDGKAVLGEDFMEPDPVNVVFDRSSTVNTTNCTSITIIEDQALEGTHAFFLHIVGISPPPAMIVGHTYATVYIHDNNNATLGFEQPSYQVAEGAGSVDVCVEISDVPSEGAECDITVSLAISDGVKAVSGEDFTAPDPLEVVFMAVMVSNGSTVCTTISIVDDMALEGPHSFSVSIVGSDPPLMTNNPQTEVTIEDNEVANVTLYSIAEVEEGEDVEVCLIVTSLPANGTECDITVNLSTVNRTATYPADFTPSELSITLTALNDPQCATIRARKDDDVECRHNFYVIFDSAGPSTVEVTPQQIEITIIDSDPGLSFTSLSRPVVDEGVGTVEICMDITFGGNLECDYVVPLTISNGIATAGDDYQRENYTITFPEGRPSGYVECTDIIIIDDNETEGEHEIFVSVPGAINFVNIVIEDNEELPTTADRAGVIAGAVIGSIVGVILIAVIVVLLALLFVYLFKKSHTKEFSPNVEVVIENETYAP